VFKQTLHGRTGPTEPHSDWLLPRFQLLLPRPTERRIMYFLSERIKDLTKLIPCFNVQSRLLPVCAVELETKSFNLRI